ncbi:MAG: glycosyltransferase [Desulfoprunum sp.]|jgi:glycosyltransferase involved in cell wall biosynthesis|uniref:glycosyltransferase n=1 Tax=Desulfoprunum sp. TaxID=2020866 RepID=UPI00052CF3D0|nr:hypothetical protein JT06_10965 [Desulfobulbus sp. Tol-SR]
MKRRRQVPGRPALSGEAGDDKRMRVVQFMASEGYGGAEQVLIELSNALAERHEVIVLLLRDAVIQGRFSPRVRQVTLRSHPTSNNPFLHIELYSRLKTIAPDIIHTHAAKGTTLVARVNRLLGYCHLGTKHNDRKGRIFNHLRWVSAVSEKAAASVLPRPGAEVRVIHNGVTVEDCGSTEKDTIFTILAVGRLDRIKGFDVLIDQVARLPFEFRLRIVGEGPERRHLEQQIQARRLDGKVSLEGFHDDIPRWMKRAHLVVISSHQEGGPKVMIEALYCADMLIATPVGAVPEVLPAMLQVEQDRLAARITEVHADYDRYRDIFAVIADRRRADFSLPLIVEQYCAYYRHILEHRNH